MISGVYRESNIGLLGGIIILLIGFVLIFCPWRLAERELSGEEGAYAVQSSEIGSGLPLATAHGVAFQNSQPLYPWLTGKLKNIGLPVEGALRLIPILALLGVGGLVFAAAADQKGKTAGFIAFAAVTGNILAFDFIQKGSPDVLAIFFVFAAHLALFHFGARHGRWDAGWVCSLSLLSLGFYAGGFTVLLYYLFPLIFLRRPLSLVKKVNNWGILAGLLILVVFIVMWLLPYFIYPQPVQYWGVGNMSWSKYFYQLLDYPVALFVRFMPWSLLGWMPLCVALFAVDTTPIYSQYLRTLFIANFFLLWFLPGFESRDLILLVAPMAVMIGRNYEVGMRRYGRKVRKWVFAIVVTGVALCAGGLLIFALAPDDWLRHLADFHRTLAFRNSDEFKTNCVIGGTLLLVTLAAFCQFGRKRWPVWLFLYFFFLSCSAVYWLAFQPYRLQNYIYDVGVRDFGADIRAALEKDGAKPELIYKIDILDLYGELYYAGIPVKKIRTLDDLPRNASSVYLIGADFPQNANWRWSNLLSADYTYRNWRICLWKGVLRSNEE